MLDGRAKTFMLMAGMTALLVTIGGMVGHGSGAVIAFGIALGMNIFSYWNADKIVLSMYKAQPVDRASAPDLFEIVEQLAGRAGLPMPRVYIVEQDQPNAFATGRNPENAAVAVTTGILRTLNASQLAGVIAHELAHIKNRDTLTMTVTASIAGAVGMLSNMLMFMGSGNRDGERPNLALSLLVMFLAPIAASLVQMAISRAREFEADRVGAEISGHPLWLASALESLETSAVEVPNTDAEHNPATAHMFIVNPLHGGMLDGLFATHPSTEDRVRRLQQIATGMSS